MKYKVGDTVTIKEDLKEDDEGEVIWDMLKYKGKSAIIVNVEDHYINIGVKIYYIDLDGGTYYWTDAMIEETRETIEVKSIPNAVSYILDTQYSCYIKSQNVSSEEKIAVKKFIEFVRKNMKDSVDNDTNNIKIK